MEQTQQTPQGKGMGVAGFVISLVALVLWLIIAGIATASALLGGGMGLAIFWLVLSLLGTALSVMGMMKLGKTGGKRGLAITGMILGIIAVILSVTTVMGVSKIHSTVGDGLGDQFKEIGRASCRERV
jgi:Flp pilus assembly pilin Flp